MTGTTRQQIMTLLREKGPLDLKALAQALGMREKEAAAHLPHVAKTAAGRGGHLRVQAACCRNCGFEFTERRRLAPPSKCPRCKQSRIEGPFYSLSGC